MDPQQQHYNENILDSYESTENALMDSFKAAALKVTTLYKDSLVQNRKAYAAGYQQALQDLYEFISSTQPENGFIPVQEVLSFARTKNNELSFEMGHAATPPAPVTTTQQKEEAKNLFAIDPHAQFTFTHNVLPFRNLDVWNQAVNEQGGKRRNNPNELSFMGRSMNMETWHDQQQPPPKRRLNNNHMQHP